MILKHSENNGVVEATILTAEANVDNADMFKNEMIQFIDRGARYVILNFEHVGYIDSSFLGSLVIALKYAISKSADIFLIELKPDIADLLKLIRMDKVFKIYKNLEQAKENIK